MKIGSGYQLSYIVLTLFEPRICNIYYLRPNDLQTCSALSVFPNTDRSLERQLSLKIQLYAEKGCLSLVSEVMITCYKFLFQKKVQISFEGFREAMRRNLCHPHNKIPLEILGPTEETSIGDSSYLRSRIAMRISCILRGIIP